jgi:DNA primase
MRNPKTILEHFHIEFVTNHPSVSKNCIGVCCPFCKDTNYHAGVFIATGVFTCWKCGEKGNLFKLIRKIKNISYKEFCEFSGIIIQDGSPKNTLDKIFNKDKVMGQPVKNEISYDGLTAVRNTIGKFTLPLIDKFLIQRGFSYYHFEEYKAFYGLGGYFKQRLVIPITDPDTNETIGLVGRDLTNTAKSKYIFNPGFQAHENFFYTSNLNFDSNTWFVLVEGIFDAWAVERLGNNFVGVAMFGSNLSNTQLDKLSLFTRKVLYIPDGDAKTRTIRKTMSMLCYPFFDQVLYIQLPPEHDPCSIPQEQLKQLIKQKII